MAASRRLDPEPTVSSSGLAGRRSAYGSSAWIIRAVKDRMQLPSTLNDALVRMGIPTEKLAMGILISPDTKWSFHEGLLETNVYPMLRIWVDMKSRKEAKKVDG